MKSKFADPVAILLILKDRLINKITNFEDLDSYFILEEELAEHVCFHFKFLFI